MIKQLAIGSVLLASAASYSYAAENKPLLETKSGSMIVFGCPKCEPEVEIKKVVLEQGSQFLEVRKVGEDLKIYRTENWLGGSPVSYIHMPSNPDDKRFAVLEEGRLDMTPLPDPLDTTAVASIGDADMMEIDLIDPKKPDVNQEIIKDVAIIDAETLEPVMASMEEKAPMTPEKPTEIDAASFELRLNQFHFILKSLRSQQPAKCCF